MAGPQTTPNGQIQPRNKKPEDKSLAGMLAKMGPEIARALPKHVNPDRMARIALTALRATPKLDKCEPGSFLGCIVQAAQLGLEVNTPLGQAYLLPFENRRQGTIVCQLIIGYQGMIDLARRSGLVKAIYAFPVYKGDEFSWELGLNPNIRHKPSVEPHRDSDLTHVYAVAKLEGGEPIFTVLTRAEVDKYRQRSRASSSGPWVTDYEAMALKTAIRRLFRWLPKSAEMARATEFDEAPEVGRPQLESADPEVLGYLQAQGIEAPAEDVDPETGEVRGPPPSEQAPNEAAPTREMGED